MKTLFLVTMFLTLPALVSAETVSIGDLVKRNGLFYKKFTNVPFTGKTSGRIQGTIKDGKLHGLVELYYENGQLEQKTNYKDGEWHGLVEKYHENGQLKEKWNYKDGKFISKTCFSESGEQKSCD